MKVEKAGLTIERKPLTQARGQYDRTRKVILVDTTRQKTPVPALLDDLFTIAHEFGHHLSQNNHEKVKRVIAYGQPHDTLFEEYRAWQDAATELRKLGMKSEKFLDFFQISMGNAIAYYVADFEAHFWLTDKVTRLKTRCPECKSRKLVILGAESQRDCQIACQRCGAHTKRRRTVFSLSKALKDQTFTGLCGCRDV